LNFTYFPAVVFAYDFHPASKTLFEAHLSAPMLNGAPQAIPERTLWSYIAQLANGLKAIHTAGLAARIIEPTKIILTGKNRCVLIAKSSFRSRGTEQSVMYQASPQLLFHF
jgi:PAB-dependent poly(A)-specific ribonuclease subunit 3